MTRSASPMKVPRLMMMGPNSPVLLAEDDENDIIFMELACENAGLTQLLRVVRNGQEAIRSLIG